MEYILAIDDTDDLVSPGTGEFLDNIIELLEKQMGCSCSRVTRHQLFFSPLVKYTSHNSSMSCIVMTDKEPVDIFKLACEYLQQNAAQGSDPGVCLLKRDAISENGLDELRKFGQKAKKEYVEKNEAYELAEKLGIMLKELGGEGIGVIGALAGAALRLDGNDGRYKGKFNLGVNQDNMKCADILSHPLIDRVMTEDGYEPRGDAEIFITDQIKTVNKKNQSVLLVKKKQTSEGEVFVNLDKSELKKY